MFQIFPTEKLRKKQGQSLSWLSHIFNIRLRGHKLILQDRWGKAATLRI